MSDTPKFEVIDRRKIKQQDEQESMSPAASEAPAASLKPVASEPAPGPRLVTPEPPRASAEPEGQGREAGAPMMPPAPSPEQSTQQKAAYDASAQRVEDLIRAQNPGAGAQPPVAFDQLIQQFYVSGLIQMGAGTPEGQQARVDILGARNTIDLLGILAEKTRGNLTEAEDSMLQAALYELRMAFLELSGMIHMPGVLPPKGTAPSR